MGAILKGRDVDLGRDIAVKVLLETHQGKTEMAQRFIEEAQIAGQLQHPGIAPVYELGVFPDRRPYFTMKLVKGKTLAALLAERKTVGWAESSRPTETMVGLENSAQPTLHSSESPRFLGIFTQVCQTLAYAHARGVIHRDLKPSNIMVGAFGEVQVMDWGLAKVLKEGGNADESRASRGGQHPETMSVIRTQRSQGSSAPDVGSNTQTGSVLGTPAYMAPEQARGEVDLVDERADVFGLGAILCEILTGRPPFTGKAVEAQRKARTAQFEDAYARLDSCGADAELIALSKRCLAAEPWDRPRDAGELAEAIMAYQQAVAERLRQAELERAQAEARAEEEKHTRQIAEEKAAAERKRRRATLGFAAAVLALVAGGGGAAAWAWQERTAVVRDVDAALAEAAGHRDAGRWPEARAALERADGRLAGLGGLAPAALHNRVRQARSDAELVAELEEIRLRQMELLQEYGIFNLSAADARYEDVLRRYGLDLTELDEQEAASRVSFSFIRQELVAALDNWILTKKAADPMRTKLRAVADSVDDNEWRRTFRAAVFAGDKTKLRDLAGQPEALVQPATALSGLARILWENGMDDQALALLRKAQRRDPGDLWLNENLGAFLALSRPPRLQEALGYFRAAVAVRPDYPALQYNLGTALMLEAKDFDGAIACLRRASELDPGDPKAHHNLGSALLGKRDFDGAIAEYRRASELRPEEVRDLYKQGNVLIEKGDVEGAIAAFRKALKVNPNDAPTHHSLGNALREKRDFNGAMAEYRKAITLNPRLAEAHGGLAGMLRDRKQLDTAVVEGLLVVQLAPHDAVARRNLGIKMVDKGELDQAIADFRKAVELDPTYAPAHHGLGVALRDRGELDNGLAELHRAAELDPRDSEIFASIGIALHNKGEETAAIAAFRRAIDLGKKGSWTYYNLGNALAQAKDLDGAIATYKKALELRPDDPAYLCNLGIALRKHGRFAEALPLLKRGHELGSKLPAWRNDSKVWVQICEQLVGLDGRLQAILKREIEPSHPYERFLFAEVSRLTKYHAVAVRYYEETFAAAPKLFGDPQAQHHFNAACAAVLAVSGLSKDNPPPDDAARVRLRRQALDWLRGDFAEWSKRLASGPPAYRLTVERALRLWQQDPDLASVRLPPRLARLPAEERAAWNALWADVETTLMKTDPRTRIVMPLWRDGRPADVIELLTVARVATHQYREFLAAVRLIKRTLAANPAWADQFQADPPCYYGACCAAMAAAGEGVGADRLEDAELRELRRLAVRWLREELGRQSKQVAASDASSRSGAAARLKYWTVDGWLAAVRDEPAVAKLPADDQKECRKLWADVAALIKKATEAK
jgi:serine/threonine-protein kinase